MTKKRIKAELGSLYQFPDPQHKEEFCKRLRNQYGDDLSGRLSLGDFLISQVRYIRPWGWLVSATVFLMALLIMNTMNLESGWKVSALVPFIAMSLITELHRSSHFKMDELEQSTRFSLKAVTLARLCIMGVSNLFVLICITPFIVNMCQISPVNAVVYLLLPYTATSFFCLIILRLWHSNESIYACAAASIGISLLCLLADWTGKITVDSSYYVISTAILLVSTLMEYRKYFTDLEELAWN